MTLTDLWQQINTIEEKLENLWFRVDGILQDIKQYDGLEPRERLPQLQDLKRRYYNDPAALELIQERIEKCEMWIASDDAHQRSLRNFNALTQAVFSENPFNNLDFGDEDVP